MVLAACSESAMEGFGERAYGDLPAVEVRDHAIGVADCHEEEALPGHQGPVIPPRSPKSESIA